MNCWLFVRFCVVVNCRFLFLFSVPLVVFAALLLLSQDCCLGFVKECRESALWIRMRRKTCMNNSGV